MLTSTSLLPLALAWVPVPGADDAAPIELTPLFHQVRSPADVAALPENAAAIRAEDADAATLRAIAARAPRALSLEWWDDERTSPLTDDLLGPLVAGPSLRRLELTYHERLGPAAYAAIAASGVETLIVDQLSLSDAHLAALSDAARLRTARIGFDRRVTPKGLRGLLAAPALEALAVSGEIGADHLASLAAGAPPDLRIGLSEGGEAALAGFAPPPGLTALGLDGSAIAEVPAGFQLPAGVTELSLAGCWRMPASAIGSAVSRAAGVAALDLSGCALDETANDALAGSRSLRRLSLVGCRGVDADAVAEAIARNPLVELRLWMWETDEGPALRQIAKASELRRLELRASRALDDRAAGRVAKLRRLEELTLAGSTQVGDGGVKALARLPALRSLDLSGLTGVSDRAVAALGAMSTLEQLDVSGTAITPRGVATLRDRLSGCDVVCRPEDPEDSDS